MKSLFPRFILAFVLLTNWAFAAGFNYAIIGDAGKWNDQARTVRQSILKTGLSQLILPGDNLYDPSAQYNDIWYHWSKMGLTFDIVALGNHYKSYTDEINYFKMPGQFFQIKPQSQALFIVLNSDNVTNAKEQATFLEKSLAEAQSQFVFVVFHHPPLTFSSFHKWQEKAAFHNLVRPLLFKYRSKITALLVGHDHVASLTLINDLPVITSGAIFETRIPEKFNNTQEGFNVLTEWTYDQTPHWVALSWDGATSYVNVSFIKSADNTVKYSTQIFTGRHIKQN